MKLEDVLNDALQAEFCEEQGYAGLIQNGNQINALSYELAISESGDYYHKLVTKDVFTLDELEEWKNVKEEMYYNI